MDVNRRNRAEFREFLIIQGIPGGAADGSGRSRMKLLNRASVLATFALFSVPAFVTVGAAETAKAMLKDAKGQDVGFVSFVQTPPACCFGFCSQRADGRACLSHPCRGQV